MEYINSSAAFSHLYLVPKKFCQLHYKHLEAGTAQTHVFPHVVHMETRTWHPLRPQGAVISTLSGQRTALPGPANLHSFKHQVKNYVRTNDRFGESGSKPGGGLVMK